LLLIGWLSRLAVVLKASFDDLLKEDRLGFSLTSTVQGGLDPYKTNFD
jgi:hypothetical protein